MVLIRQADATPASLQHADKFSADRFHVYNPLGFIIIKQFAWCCCLQNRQHDADHSSLSYETFVSLLNLAVFNKCEYVLKKLLA